MITLQKNRIKLIIHFEYKLYLKSIEYKYIYNKFNKQMSAKAKTTKPTKDIKTKPTKPTKTVSDIKQKPEEPNITSPAQPQMNNLIKTRLYGVEWTNNNSKCKFKTDVKDRAMTTVINNRPPEPNIIIERNNNGRFWSAIDPEQTLKLFTKDYQLYEVLTTDRPRKVYFDIDYLGKADDAFLPLILNGIQEVLPYSDADIAISGSVNDVKTSYHIVLNNYIIKTDTDRNVLKGNCILSELACPDSI